ncbi:MAG: DUF1902 domain-containing protein [Defluviitaleaceae bacterium]|nr:DUF1902 domain-containing protein [Defluviitaleaceae bacterium]
METYKINFMWDKEVSVWIATSDDIKGLVLEHSSFDALLERVRVAVPELLEMEKIFPNNLFLDYSISCSERISLNR